MSTTSQRVYFVDLARAAAVLFMIQGHTLQVLLSPQYQNGTLFNIWLYLRGLTSCSFLILAGFSFSLATIRHWDEYNTLTGRARHRLARFAMFLVLGYAMHLPIRPLSDMPRVTADQWRAFATVDILHLVAVTLAALQGLAWLTRTPRRLGIYSLIATVTIVLLTPIVWRIHWPDIAPTLLASYFSTATGSLFPLFPWAAYVFLGAALGVWFTQGRQGCATSGPPAAFVTMGAMMFTTGVLLHRLPLSPYGPIDFWTTSPNLFLVKAGSVLVLLAVAARITRSGTALPTAVTALSRESLTIYFVHVCVLYGSIWNTGLFQIIGPRLDLPAAATWVAVLAASMSLLAWAWHECKRRRELVAALVRVSVTAALLYNIA